MRTKYGIATNPTPNMTSKIVLETKYGRIIKTTPVSSGTTIFCRRPYTKKPRPIEPKSKPQRRVDVSIAILGAAEADAWSMNLRSAPTDAQEPSARHLYRIVAARLNIVRHSPLQQMFSA